MLFAINQGLGRKTFHCCLLQIDIFFGVKLYCAELSTGKSHFVYYEDVPFIHNVSYISCTTSLIEQN